MKKIILVLAVAASLLSAKGGKFECVTALKTLLDSEGVDYKIDSKFFGNNLFEVDLYIKSNGNHIRKEDDSIKINNMPVKALCIFNENKNTVTEMKISTKTNKTLYWFH